MHRDTHQPEHDSSHQLPHGLQQQQQQQERHPDQHHQPQRAPHPRSVGEHKRHLRPQPRQGRRTHPLVWLLAALCTIFCIIIILGGLLVLIVYLAYRPHLPRFDVAAATLNGAYLDQGALLNADVTLLANLSNPNRKLHVAFSYVEVDLYFETTMVATGTVAPLALRHGEAALRSVHLVASEVALPQDAANEWRRGVAGPGVALTVVGRLQTRLDPVRWLRFRYWLEGICSIAMGGPPNGVMLARQCRTKSAKLSVVM